MSNINFWQTREDGVVYAEPEGFFVGYFIYPPHFEGSNSNQYELWLIDINGGFTHDENYQFSNLELAKKYAVNKFKEIIAPYLAV